VTGRAGAGLALALLAAAPARAGQVELPSVPAAVLAAADGSGEAPPARRPPDAGERPREPGSLLVEAEPGVNQIVPIALGHLNRIVTPFAHPRVHTSSAASTRIDGPVIYLATGDAEPVSLFVTAAGSEAVAISLTLVPRRIPPREIRLRLAGAPAPLAGGAEGRAATAQVARLRGVLRALALGQVPAGFALRAAHPGEGVRCAQAGLRARLGQVLEGHGLWLLVALLENGGDDPLELDETACTAASAGALVAAAGWPRVWLAPGERTELYLALRPPARRSPERERPSLAGAGGPFP